MNIAIISVLGPTAPGQSNYRPSGQVFPPPHGAPQGYHGYPPNQQRQPPPGQVQILNINEYCEYTKYV